MHYLELPKKPSDFQSSDWKIKDSTNHSLKPKRHLGRKIDNSLYSEGHVGRMGEGNNTREYWLRRGGTKDGFTENRAAQLTSAISTPENI